MDGAVQAVADALPEGTTLGFSSDGDERTWMRAIGPGDSSDPVVTREVLNTALASLNRCALGGYGDGQEGAPLPWVSQQVQ